MRFKLDENLPVELADMFREAGHDSVTVLDQDLMGARDSDLTAVCMREGRVLVTFDTDFADIRTYPPDAYPGLVCFRLDSRARGHVLEIGTRLLTLLSSADTSGQLWKVEESRIRVRQ